MKELRGKKALVTGGAMGIGLATTKRLLKEGCEVTVWDLDEKAMAGVKKELESLGKVFFHQCDITDKTKVFALAEEAKKDMGQVDILINNAGFVMSGKFCDVPLKAWEREEDVNLRAILYTTYAFLPDMYKRNSGHIVNISSAAGLMGVADLAVYCATKWAVWGLTESLRLEAMTDKKSGIKYSSIHPGFLKHGMFEGGSFNWLGNLLFPPIKDHDIIAEAIVEKALKKNRHVVKIPKIIQIGIISRGLLPDIVLSYVLLAMGIGKSMRNWKGRPGSTHADPRAFK